MSHSTGPLKPRLGGSKDSGSMLTMVRSPGIYVSGMPPQPPASDSRAGSKFEEAQECIQQLLSPQWWRCLLTSVSLAPHEPLRANLPSVSGERMAGLCNCLCMWVGPSCG